LQLPDFPPISGETLEAICERHDLRADKISPLKEVGSRLQGEPRLARTPGPVRVSRRVSENNNRCVTSATSRSRPTRGVGAAEAGCWCGPLVSSRAGTQKVDQAQ
jgi:hypothetical protein